jgi:hypothetical protein
MPRSVQAETIAHFIDEVLVDCPQCRGLAVVLAPGGLRAKSPALSCSGCGFNRSGWPNGASIPPSIRLGEPFDPYFGYPLRLQKPLGREVLWAYNRRHLAFLRAFIGAGIRPKTPHANASLASRLPAWMKKATRRAHLLKGIASLEKQLG